MKSDLIVALDLPTTAEIAAAIATLPNEIAYYKIGLELFAAEGPAALEPIKAKGSNIFLDLKLHDIPRTVERAVAAAAKHNVTLLTVHASGGTDMLKAAAESAKANNPDMKLVAVTTLTSLDQHDLTDLGIQRELKDQALALTELALNAGIDGIVCSALEVKSLRSHFGNEPIMVTPGIRMADGDVGDQKRIATPANAVRDGASHLVVGRPIIQADDPAAAATEILRQMHEA